MGVEPNFKQLSKDENNEKKNSISSSSARGADGRMQWRTEVLPKVKEVLAGFRSIGVNHPTIRAVYYKLYSMGALPENNIKMYKGLDRMLTEVRMEQEDDEVKPDTFADDSRPDPDDIEVKTTSKNYMPHILIISDLFVIFISHRYPSIIEDTQTCL